MKSDLYRVLFGLGVAFGLPWLLLIVLPYLDLSAKELVTTDYTDADQVEGAVAYPRYVATGQVSQGEKIYAANGCAYCHTQMVRPTYAGADMWREGWGGRSEGEFARETRPADYVGEDYAHLGYQRIGPDLSNVGWRITDRAWHHLHLYNARAISGREQSVMPSFKHLYKEQKIGPQPSEEALPLTGDFAPKEGFEVVPTPEADALVDYLLSRKKDARIPGEAPPKS